MKKIITTLGAFTMTIAPISAVIACSSKETISTKITPSLNESNQDNEQSKRDNGNAKNDRGNTKNENIEELNPFANVKDDGLFLWDKTYSGKVWSGDTIKDGVEETGVKKIYEQKGWSLDPSVQLGKRNPSDSAEPEDSFYMVYDKDDNDGLNINNFTDTIFFEDTSTAMDNDIYEVNEKIFGNTTHVSGPIKTTYVNFSKDGNNQYSGSLNNYMGAQNNHISSGKGYATPEDFMKKMEELADQYEDTRPKVLNAILKYYGYKTARNVDGSFDIDNSILNHASIGFAPVFYKKSIFTYKKIFNNVIKITYHDDDNFQATAAHFRIKEKDGSFKSFGSWSLGHNDWSSYWNHPEAKYIGLKKE